MRIARSFACSPPTHPHLVQIILCGYGGVRLEGFRSLPKCGESCSVAAWHDPCFLFGFSLVCPMNWGGLFLFLFQNTCGFRASHIVAHWSIEARGDGGDSMRAKGRNVLTCPRQKSAVTRVRRSRGCNGNSTNSPHPRGAGLTPFQISPSAIATQLSVYLCVYVCDISTVSACAHVRFASPVQWPRLMVGQRICLVPHPTSSG